MSFAKETNNLTNELIQAEYKNACEKWSDKYHSLHEGYAVLKEEIEEVRDEYNGILSDYHLLWEDIKDNEYYNLLDGIDSIQKSLISTIQELAQVGAVLMKIRNTIDEVEE